LPEGTVVSIKEPFYHMEDDGRYALRVDHPSDMVVLDPRHQLYPEQWQSCDETQMTALGWKLEGDRAMNRDEHLEAYRWQVPNDRSELHNALPNSYQNARPFWGTQ
jgi:hypothetical protein